jgi:hypothetical protein
MPLGDEVVIIGGDHNAHVGAGEGKDNIKGRYGLRSSNEAGNDLINWCEANGLAYTNSFFNNRGRGTWFSMIHRRWYELDGFLIRQQHRQKRVKNITTVNESALSDHQPKKMQIWIERKKWRRGCNSKRRLPQIAKEELTTSQEKRDRYREETTNRLEAATEEGKIEEDSTNLDVLANIMTESGREVCGVKKKRINKPWLVGREERMEEMRENISAWVTTGNERMNRRRTRRGIRELEEAKRSLKETRNIQKR